MVSLCSCFVAVSSPIPTLDASGAEEYFIGEDSAGERAILCLVERAVQVCARVCVC